MNINQMTAWMISEWGSAIKQSGLPASRWQHCQERLDKAIAKRARRLKRDKARRTVILRGQIK